MYLDQAKKKEIFEKYGKTVADTGSVESQVALFTYRISHLTEHLKKNHKDFGTARSLTMLVGKRRKLLKYKKPRKLRGFFIGFYFCNVIFTFFFVIFLQLVNTASFLARMVMF